MDITKLYIGAYKLKKCLIAQYKGINLTSGIIIVILLGIAIFQQLYYPREIEQKTAAFKKHLEYLQYSYNNITNGMEDLKLKVEDYNAKEWKGNIEEVRVLLEKLDDKVSYFETTIFNYFSPGRIKRQKFIY